MIEKIIKERGIKEVVHFSTLNGVVGILDSGFLKSRHRVSEDQRLEFILKENSALRKDTPWLDYVNLSITNINHEFFKVSSKKWHQDARWRILSFSPEILMHEGVTFTNTNNVYSCVLRGKGAEGLNCMFAQNVEWGYYGSVINRTSKHSIFEPTDIQAEVLYPKEVSIDYLQRIYVNSDDDQDQVCGVINALRAPNIEVIVAPEKFGAL